MSGLRLALYEYIDCYTPREIFNFYHYKTISDIVSLQRILGHANRRDTLVYICMIQDKIVKSLRKFN